MIDLIFGPCRQDNFCPLPAKGKSHGTTQPPSTAGNDRDFILQLHGLSKMMQTYFIPPFPLL
jgi:hypothetical protein